MNEQEKKWYDDLTDYDRLMGFLFRAKNNNIDPYYEVGNEYPLEVSVDYPYSKDESDGRIIFTFERENHRLTGIHIEPYPPDSQPTS